MRNPRTAKGNPGIFACGWGRLRVCVGGRRCEYMLTDIPCSTSSGENDFRGKSFSPPSPTQGTQAFLRKASWLVPFPLPSLRTKRTHPADEKPAAMPAGNKPSPHRGRWFSAFPRKAENRMRRNFAYPPRFTSQTISTQYPRSRRITAKQKGPPSCTDSRPFRTLERFAFL